MGVQFEEILAQVGNFGRYQKQLIWTFLIQIVTLWSFFSMNHIFQLATPDHWCHVPGRGELNITLEEWKNLTLPRMTGSNALERYAQCEQFNISKLLSPGISAEMLKTAITESERSGELDSIPCHQGWEYDTSLYASTASSQYNWVCDEKSKVTWAYTMTSVGTFVGSFIFNNLADSVGRRYSFYMSASFHIIFGIVMMYVASFPWFLVTLFIKSMSFPCCFQIAFIMVMEQIGPEYRGELNGYFNLIYTIGMCLLVALAWICSGHWIYFGYATTLPVLCVYLYWPFIKESPRWLTTTGRLSETAEILVHIARKNRTEIPSNLEDMLKSASETKETSFGMPSLFVKPRTRIRTLLTVFIWSACVIVYFGLHLNINNLGGNDYLNFLVYAAIELPAYFLAWKTSEKISRRWMQVFFMGFGGISLLLVAALPAGSYSAVVALSVMGKFGSSGSFMLIYLQAMEIFPTVNRAAAMGLSTVCGNMANILSPFIVSLGDFYQPAQFLIFGGLAVAAAIAGMFLPESAHEALPQTLEDSEEYGRQQRFWSLNFPTEKTSGQNTNRDDPCYPSY